MKKEVVLVATAKDLGQFGTGSMMVPGAMMVPAPPLNVLALASYLAAHDVPVQVIDMQVDFGVGMDPASAQVVYERVAQHLRDRADDIAWIGVSQTASMDNGLPVAQAIHAALPDIPLVFGGYFPSRTYGRMLKEYPFIKAVVHGDGEVAALEISRRIAQGRPFVSDEIPNLAWLDQDRVRATPRLSIAPEQLPLIDFRFLRNPGCYPVTYLMTSRGCPFHCNYCLEPVMRTYSVHPAERVAEQLDHVEAVLRNDKVFFIDPIFVPRHERTEEICRAMSGRRFSYFIESRVDTLAPAHIPPLRKAGVDLIYFGFESASPGTLVRMDKLRYEASGERYVAKARAVVEACFENDVTPILGFMLAFPGDTESDYRASLDFAREIEQLYDRITAKTGINTGFSIGCSPTQMFEGSPMEKKIGNELPQVPLSPEWALGSSMVLSPSPGVDEALTSRYQKDIKRCEKRTSLAAARNIPYREFSMDRFVAEYPHAVGKDGVVRLSDDLFGAISSEVAHTIANEGTPARPATSKSQKRRWISWS